MAVGTLGVQLEGTARVKWKAGSPPFAEEVGFAFPDPFHPPDVRPTPDYRWVGLDPKATCP